IGEYLIKYNVKSKNNNGEFSGEFLLKNQENNTSYTTGNSYFNGNNNSSGSSVINIINDEILVQSGLDSDNNCLKSDCSINLNYIPDNSKLKCLWDFGSGVHSQNSKNKCNPASVKYSPGEHIIYLKVYQEDISSNYKEISFKVKNFIDDSKIIFNKENLINEKYQITEENNKIIPKIELQGRLKSNIIIDGKNIYCNSEDCNLNFDGKNSIFPKNSQFLWDYGDGDKNFTSNPPSKKYLNGEYILKFYITNGENVDYDYFNIFVGNENSSFSNENMEDIIIKSGIIISSVLANPKGKDNFEYFELYNTNNSNFDLSGCFIKYGNKRYFFENIFLNSKENIKFFNIDTNLNLSNSKGFDLNLYCDDLLIDNFFWGYSSLDDFIIFRKYLDFDYDEIILNKNEFLLFNNQELIFSQNLQKINPIFEIDKYLFDKNIKNEKRKEFANTYFTQEIKLLKSGIKIEGTSIPNSKVLIEIKPKNKFMFIPKIYAFKTLEIFVDNFGNYSTLIENISSGNYIILSKAILNDEIINIDLEENINIEEDIEKININLDNLEIIIQTKKSQNNEILNNKIICFLEECSINFISSITNKNLEYFWDFGNNKTFLGHNPAGVKFQTGEYKVSLTVSDGENKKTVYYDIIIGGKNNENNTSKNIIYTENNTSNENIDEFYLFKFKFGVLIFLIFFVLSFLVFRKQELI
ncbi:MAG: hypothetical protein NWP80_01660, partial [Candidatus Gracilibacteria bacterium]|nr:hypothetical protein [Candidatus Gracilibacteria bacterium]